MMRSLALLALHTSCAPPATCPPPSFTAEQRLSKELYGCQRAILTDLANGALSSRELGRAWRHMDSAQHPDDDHRLDETGWDRSAFAPFVSSFDAISLYPKLIDNGGLATIDVLRNPPDIRSGDLIILERFADVHGPNDGVILVESFDRLTGKVKGLATDGYSPVQSIKWMASLAPSSAPRHPPRQGLAVLRSKGAACSYKPSAASRDVEIGRLRDTCGDSELVFKLRGVPAEESVSRIYVTISINDPDSLMNPWGKNRIRAPESEGVEIANQVFMRNGTLVDSQTMFIDFISKEAHGRVKLKPNFWIDSSTGTCWTTSALDYAF